MRAEKKGFSSIKYTLCTQDAHLFGTQREPTSRGVDCGVLKVRITCTKYSKGWVHALERVSIRVGEENRAEKRVFLQLKILCAHKTHIFL